MNSNFEPIAIVGVSGLFPGAKDFNGFWDNIVDRRDASRPIPESRWPKPSSDFFDSEVAKPDHLYSTRACLLDDIPFDPSRFPLPREWFEGLDPVFQLTLHVGARAYADCQREAVDPKRVGVRLANIVLPTDTTSAVTRKLFGEMARRRRSNDSGLALDGPLWTHPLNRFMAGAPAGLLARALGLGGGSYTLDAACASSLYAIKLACDALQARRADAMIAGGVCRPESTYTQMGFSQLRALSPTGTPRPLDANADGIVVGEGAGMFVLKRLEDALHQGDKIYGVIRGVGLSNDRGGSLLAPDSEGQMRAMSQVYARAGWRPWDVDLIECHATGTPVGDATEIRSLLKLWEGSDAEAGSCGLGSVKSNVGHLLTAAGAASLMKVLLGFAHETLPPTANFETPPDGIDLADSPFRVQTEARPWRPRLQDYPLRAAVSAFGFGGINGHLLVEDFHEASVGGRETIAFSEDTTQRRGDSGAAGGEAPRVALVGMDVRVGPYADLKAFQAGTLGGEIALGERPAARWWGLDEGGALSGIGRDVSAWRGAYMDAVEAPLGRFRIPPKELEEMLPQQLLMLSAVDAALRDAGDHEDDPAQTGVFVGIGLDMNTTNFYARWCLPEDAKAWSGDGNEANDGEGSPADEGGPALTANRVLGALGGMVASRIARELKAGGPSFTISGEENSGVRALEVGVRALQAGEIDSAVVGAVDLGGDLRSMLASEALRPYARDEVRPLGARESGSAQGEGAVAFVLRRLEDAERDGQRVYAVIDGLGFASGGDGASLAASSDAYAQAVRQAHEEAGLATGDIGLLEVWGSGFGPEDDAESAALAEVFGFEGNQDAPTCALAGLQAQIGNTGAAAGLASIARAALCLQQSILPESCGMLDPRADLKGADSPFFTSRTPQYWFRDRDRGERVAGASCMSLDGNVSHVVLSAREGAAEAEDRRPIAPPREALFALEGDARADLLEQLYTLTEFVLDDERIAELPLHDAAREWWRTNASRHGARLGLAFVARSRRELVDQFETARVYLEGNDTRRLEEAVPAKDRIFFNPAPLEHPGEIAFVFPGSGNQYVGMGAELGARWPHLLRQLDREYGYLDSQFSPSKFAPYRIDWSEGWEADARRAIIEDHRSLIFGHVSHSAFLSDVARQFGLEPDAVIGYSLGETAGYFALRAWNDRDEMMRRVQDSTLFTEDLVGRYRSARTFWNLSDEEPLEWRVGVVDRSAPDVRAVLREIERVYLLIVNTPRECVIGGEAGAVQEAVDRLECSFFPLQGISTVHCEVAKPVRDRYRGLHLFRTTPPPGVRFYSGAFGRSFDLGRQSAADSIVGQAITGFEFPRVIESAYEDGVRVFLEMGPQASCTRMIGRILGERPHVARSICLQGQGGASGVLRFLARLISERVPVDLTPLFDEGTPSPQVPRSRIRVTLGGDLSAPAEIIHEPEPVPPPEPEPSPMPAEAEPVHAGDGDGAEKAPESPEAPPAPSQKTGGTAREEAQRGEQTAGVPPGGAVPPRRETEIREPVTPGGTTISEELIASIAAAQRASAEAHETFLRISQASVESQSRALQLQMSLFEALGTDMGASAEHEPSRPAPTAPIRPAGPEPPAEPETEAISPPAETPRTFDRERCLEFARGKIVNVLGRDFAEIDHYPTRVRLPDEPLMLVDRITATEGEPGSLGPGRLVTEHDVLPDAWYLDGGRMAPGVTIEAGQADLFLCAYLGIDFETKGVGKYRLLDAAVTYHRSLPRPGDVIRYDIRIERFARQGSTHLFFFNYDGYIGEERLMTMRGGCAGFFSDRQLDEGRGLVLTDPEREPRAGVAPEDWSPPVELARENYTAAALNLLRDGDLPACFGPAFEQLDVRRPYTLPSGDLDLLDRVTDVVPDGGRYGLGMIYAEKDIDPEAWFLTCHFVDDPVMPGTLMYESSLQALRVLLLRMGWVGEADRVVYEPRPGVNSRLRCRGQVKPGTRTAAYEVSIKELGFGPEPYAIADTIMYADGHPIVLVSDISIQLTGLTRADIDRVWEGAATGGAQEEVAGSARRGADRVSTEAAPAVVDRDRIVSFTNGSLVHAFGERYRPFDEGRFIARLPQEPFLFLDRVTKINSPAWELVSGGEIETQFDVSPDAWFFKANRQPGLPFSVLLEYPLQSCGWFSAYMGSALQSDEELHYRNLGGRATLYEDLGRDTGTLTARIETTNLSKSAGMLIQNFSMTVFREGRKVYLGDTSFGFFSNKALSQQVGVRGAAPYEPTPEELENCITADLDGGEPLTPEGAMQTPYPGTGMPARAYQMIDRIEAFAPDGGPKRLGFIRGTKPVNPEDWFFQAHFFQDPVWPGSLGLEGFLQLLKFVAYHHWGDRLREGYHFEPIARRIEHQWVYRGQVIPGNRQVTIEAVILKRDPERLLVQGDGFLKVDGLVIYEMRGFAVRAVQDRT